MHIDFGNGGAFAEVHVPQYPRGLGQQSNSAVRGTQYGVSVRIIENTLSVKSTTSGALTLVSNAAQDAERVEHTREALRKKLDEQQSNVGNYAQRGDPLDPRLRQVGRAEKAQSNAVVIADPGPIVRSPTKRPKSKEEEASEKELSSVPFCVSSWTNKKNLVIGLDDRIASAHEKKEGPQLASHHIDLAQALQRARRDVKGRQEQSERMEREAREVQQAAVEETALKEAQILLEKMEKDKATQRSTETREEREQRRQLERDHREREREVKAKLRRHQDAATRLGITVEALEADADLLRSIDEGSMHESDLSQFVDSRVMQDVAAHEHAAVAGHSTLRLKETQVSTQGIENEIKILDSQAPQGDSHRKRTRDEDDDSDSDEDMFGIGSVLANSTRARKTE